MRRGRSPTHRFVVHEKAPEWLTGGMRVVWVVDLQRHTVTVGASLGHAQTLTERDTPHGASGLTNLRIPARELFG